MSDKKISQLDSLSSANAVGDDIIPIVNAGSTKSITLEGLKSTLIDLGLVLDKVLVNPQVDPGTTPNSLVVSGDSVYFVDASGTPVEIVLSGSTASLGKVLLTNQSDVTGHEADVIFMKDERLYWVNGSNAAQKVLSEGDEASLDKIILAQQASLTGHQPGSIITQNDKLYLLDSSSEAQEIVKVGDSPVLNKIILENQTDLTGHVPGSIILKDDVLYLINTAGEAVEIGAAAGGGSGGGGSTPDPDTLLCVKLLEEDFESYADTAAFAAEWTVVESASEPNKWALGTAPGGTGKSVYVSDDGGVTAGYTHNACYMHFYKDITFPANMLEGFCKITWKAVGETNYDFGTVALTGTSFTPDNSYSGNLVPIQDRLFKSVDDDGELMSQSTWIETKDLLNVASLEGQTKRFIISWKNDSVTGNGAAFCIDNIELYYFIRQEDIPA